MDDLSVVYGRCDLPVATGSVAIIYQSGEPVVWVAGWEVWGLRREWLPEWLESIGLEYLQTIIIY